MLEINQGAVSKMEKRTDMCVSTLRNSIQAIGGQLQVKAIFPEEVEIDQFRVCCRTAGRSPRTPCCD